MKITPYRSTNNYQDKNSKSKTFNSQHSPSQIFSSMHLGADTPVFMFQAGDLWDADLSCIELKELPFISFSAQEVLETGKKNLSGNGRYKQSGQFGENTQTLLTKESFKASGDE